MPHPEEATYVSVRIGPNPDCRLDHGLCSLSWFLSSHLSFIGDISHHRDPFGHHLCRSGGISLPHISFLFLLTNPPCLLRSPAGRFFSHRVFDAPVLSPFLFV
jgi:hypothetical protein